MAEFKVDLVHHHYNRTSEKLEVWCFNDPNAYEPRARKLMARYDFGRKPNHEDGTPADRKQKLLVGLYREPYRDGWKYTIFGKVHPDMLITVFEYIFFGFQENEDGEMEPFTYLRHNRKALGIHYLFERYVKYCRITKGWISRQFYTDYDYDYPNGFEDYTAEPYFPTPQTYKGFNIATKWDGTMFYNGYRRHIPNWK